MKNAWQHVDNDCLRVADLFIRLFSPDTRLMAADDPTAEDRVANIQRFIEKLGVEAVLEAMTIATDKARQGGWDDERCFRYFCGIGWHMVRGEPVRPNRNFAPARRKTRAQTSDGNVIDFAAYYHRRKAATSGPDAA